ncbi:MAG TPA: hypothetical protein VM055_06270 [Novosphingobium sp.]|nr:hypothetical protein [Novosphingobium sp.]
MFNRSLPILALAALALAPLPAAAKSDTTKMAEKMRDPAMQGAVAAALRVMSEAMLDLRVAPFLKAVEAVRDPERARDIDPDLRVRDVAPEAGRVPEEMSRRVPAMMGAMGGMAEAVGAMTPVLKDMAREMGAAMGEAVAEARDHAGRAEDRSHRDEPVPEAQEE